MNAGEGPLLRVYAGALFELAREKGELEERKAEAELLLDVLDREKRIGRVLVSPRVTASRKTSFVREVFGDHFSRDLRSFVLLLVEKNRQVFLREMLGTFVELCEEEKGDLRGRVTTAAPLAEEDAAALVEELSRRAGRRVILEKTVDPQLLGGGVLRIGDILADGSLRRRIRELRLRLLAPPGT